MDDFDRMECRHYYHTVAFVKMVYGTVSLTPLQIESIRSENGSTPLLRACRYGYSTIVTYLLENCHADVEEVGSVSFKDDDPPENVNLCYFLKNYDIPTEKPGQYDGIAPLFCAAMSCEFNIVKTLITHKAAVNCRNKEGFTPLHAACLKGCLSIVKYLVEHGADIELTDYEDHTCLMVASKGGYFKIVEYLIRKGSDVNYNTGSGSTALHFAASSGSLLTVETLLKHGAIVSHDYWKVTPLLTAALYAQESIVSYFRLEFQFSRREIINALELLGAAYMKDHEYQNIKKGINLWCRALTLRQENDVFLRKADEPSPLSVIMNVMEVETLEELKELETDLDELDKQCLLVRERILGISHSDCARLVLDYCDNCYNLDEHIRLQIHTLDELHKVVEPFSLNSRCNALPLLFSFCRIPLDQIVLYTKDIIRVLHIVVDEIELYFSLPVTYQKYKDSEQLSEIVIQVVPILKLLCCLNLQPCEEEELLRWTEQLVKIQPRVVNNSTLLHFACLKSISSLEVMDLLLKAGADPNAVDDEMNTPLHIAAEHSELPEAAVQSLLRYGAHLDYRNRERKTALQLMEPTATFSIEPLQYLNLRCLCAEVIRSSDMPYRNRVPKHVEFFIDSH